MIAHRRADVAELNALARARMHQDGRLSDNELESAGRAFAVGDRVIARHNDRRLAIVNGTRGTVTALHEDRRAIEVQLDNGPSVEIDIPYLEDGHLDPGYAVTAHAAQGATVDQAFVLGSDDLYREWGYTAFTRHRDEARFYIVSPGSTERCLPGLEPENDPVAEQVRDMLGQTRRKELASEILERGRGEMPPEQELPRTQDAANEQLELSARISDEPKLPIDADRVRVALCDPSTTLTTRIGSRPLGLHDRDIWAKAARRLLQLPDVLDPVLGPDTGPELDDVGMDL